MAAQATATLKNDLMALEHRYWDGMKRRDGATATRLTHDNCLVIGQEGLSRLSGREIGRMTETAPAEIEEFTIDEQSIECMPLADDVAVIAYRVRERMKKEGRAETLNFFDSTTWVRVDGNWQAAVHTETPIAMGQPRR